MTEFIQTPNHSQELEGIDQLRSYFELGGKPRQAWRVGTEYEQVGVYTATGRAAPYSGAAGIETILRELASRYGWKPKLEDGRIIALYRDQASVTLEPGGQLELAGGQCATIHEAHQEFTTYSREIASVGSDFGISFLGLGIQPISAVNDIEMVPKQRYRIMAPYMSTVGKLGLRMMKQTAAVQVNLDYADEADAMDKLRTAMGLSPIVNAMFANSSIAEGKLSGYVSLRGHIWTDTDPARAGLLPFVFSGTTGFEEYVKWALDAPMYFTIRSGRYVDLTGMPFRRFLTHGHGDMRATTGDWSLHLTTLFLEARLKTYLEVRTPDSQPSHLALAVPALWKGVLYEPGCLEAAWDLVKRWSWDERICAYHDAHRDGLRTRVGRVSLLDLAREILAIAWHGLDQQEALNPNGEDETVYLERLDQQMRSGSSPGQYAAENWAGPWNEDVAHLIAFSSYRGEGSSRSGPPLA